MQAQTQTPKYQGDPSVQALANGLGTLGRYGDEYMVHAAHGETVIPAEILAANPELKNQLFQQMRMMGIKDPNRYVVGNSLNSINPLTGQPEFFFKKIFKAIKKVVKKIAPIVVPILGNMIAPGIGGPIASALYSKATGGSWGDALKSAALSYGASALGSGVSNMLGTPGGGIGDFFSGVKEGALAPFTAAGNLFSSGAQNPLAQGVFGPRGMNLAFQSTQPIVKSSFAPQGNWWQKAAGTVFPTYDAGLGVGGNTFQGNQPVTATQQQQTQLSGAGTAASPGTGGGGGQPSFGQQGYVAPGQGPIGFDGSSDPRWNTVTARGVPVNQGNVTNAGTANLGDGTMNAQVANNTTSFSPSAGDAYDPGAVNASANSAVVGGAGNVASSSGSTLGNAWDWINRNRLLTLAGATGLYYLSQDEEDPMPDRDEFLAMTDPERLAYEQFTALSDAEKRGAQGNALLRQSGIAPRYSPTEIARITGIPHADAVNFYAGAYGGNTMNAAKGGVASFAWGGGSIADFIKRRDSGFASPDDNNGLGSLTNNSFIGKLFTNPELFRSVLRNNDVTQEKAPVMDLEDGPIIEAEGEVVGTGPVQGMPQLGTLTTGGDDLNSANQSTLQQRGEGAPFVFQNTSYIASSSGPVLQGPDRTQQPGPIPLGQPGGGNPLFLKMVDQAQNAMINKQPGPALPMGQPPGGNPFVNILQQQASNEPLLIKSANNNTQTGIQLAKQLGGSPYRAGQALGQLRAANGGEIEGPGTGTSDSIPANLSDGEFVMTAEAVRNAGGGDRNLGAARMYDLMNRFEGGRA